MRLLSSMEDITGLIPALFQRGQPAAAAEQAERAQREAASLARGRQDRDNLRLSPDARGVVGHPSAEEGAVAEAEGGSLPGQAGGFIRKALETIRHDLAKALRAFGFDGAAVENFTKAFVEPVLSALKEGVNFTAELSFAAFSQMTTLSANGDFNQQTSLVAQSLEIAVNHDTGEVSVSLAKLAFEQEIQSRGGAAGGTVPLLVIDGDDLASAQELAAKILASGEKPAAPEDPVPEMPAEAGAPSHALQERLAALRERLAEDAVSLQTQLTIHSINVSRNEKGETVTTLLLDAQLSVARLAEDAAAQAEAKSLDLTA